MEKLSIDDLGLEFADLGNEEGTYTFGPSQTALKSFKGWSGCDGKFFKPYNMQDKVGKLSDFVTAAIQAAKDKERELDKNEFQKKKDADAADKKKAEKKINKKQA